MRMPSPQYVLSAVKTVFSHSRGYQVWFVVLTVVVFSAYILVPVLLTPGNSLAFQLSLMRFQDYALLAVLSLATALLMTMQAFLFFRSKERAAKATALGQSGIGVSSAFFGGLLATAVCPSCIAALIGFLGAGGVFFVLDNQRSIVFVALVLVGAGLYFTIRRVNGHCEKCLLPTQEDSQG